MLLRLGETAEEKNLYKLIRLRAVASQLDNAVFAVRVATLEAELEGKPVIFEARGKTLVSKGWKSLLPEDQTEDPEKKTEPDNNVPKLEVGVIITANKGQVQSKKTKPQPRFTEAALIKELERKGIGRPSTYAAILDNITSREYLKLEKRFLVPTPVGETVVDSLKSHFSFLDYDFTKNLENNLDSLAIGEANYIDVVRKAFQKLEGEVDNFMIDNGHVCPDCGKALRHQMREEKNGQKGFNFWGCSGYPECRTTLNDVNGHPGQKVEKKEHPNFTEFKCKECGAPLIHRQGTNKNGKEYDLFGCSAFPKCKQSYFSKDGKPEYGDSKKK